MGDEGAAYGVEIRLGDGSQVEVNLDENCQVIGQEADDNGPNDEDGPDDDSDGDSSDDDGPDDDSSGDGDGSRNQPLLGFGSQVRTQRKAFVTGAARIFGGDPSPLRNDG